MIVTTTQTIEGHRITAYHGLVVGEVIMGAEFSCAISWRRLPTSLAGALACMKPNWPTPGPEACRELEERRPRFGRECRCRR